MPKLSGRYARSARRYGRRNRAQRTIASAWRARNRRRKGGLIPRTVKANRKAIKSIKSNTEINFISNVLATPAVEFGGQVLRQTNLTNTGLDAASGRNLVWKPWRGMGKGVNSNQRNGDVVTMSSLTYKIKVAPATGALTDGYNEVGCYIVLDTSPNDAADSLPNLCNGTAAAPAIPFASTNKGTLLTGDSSFQTAMENYLNMDTCAGSSPRYKVLKHHHCYVQPVAAGSTLMPIKYFTGTIKSPYKVRYNQQDADVPGTEIKPVDQELLFFFYSDSAVTPHPSVQASCRFRYRDA
ncbi:MAG: putative capsid protein [Cressdnaviricota sp.]|nr:MAG: putative capsid protein [Cressdnaviricota sp.]